MVEEEHVPIQSTNSIENECMTMRQFSFLFFSETTYLSWSIFNFIDKMANADKSTNHQMAEVLSNAKIDHQFTFEGYLIISL